MSALKSLIAAAAGASVIAAALIGSTVQPRTAATPGTVHFTASGDIAARAESAAVLSQVDALDPDLHLALGDLSYGATGAEQTWCDFVTARVGAGFPFELISGNHESDGLNGNINDFSACLPNQLPGAVGTYGRQYYVDVPAVNPLVRFVNRLTNNRMPPRRSPYSSAPLDNCAAPSPLVPGDEVPSGPGSQLPTTFREDAVTQNQLTLVTVVTPGQANRVRAVMAAIDALAKRLTPPGSLIGVSTIHFVKWLVIDDGRRLMMVSDYDGSWESYIDEFAEMILSGLDAIWETAYGYPPDGARDVPAFKRFLRSHQVPSEVFFSAYPEETVLNMTNDLNFARACADAVGGRPQATLQRL